SCPTDRCADESPVPMSRVPQDSSLLAGSAASGEARRGLLVYAWRHRSPGWPNPNHSSSPCSFSFSMNFGASSMIRVLLSAPLCLHIRLSSRFICWPDIWIVPVGSGVDVGDWQGMSDSTGWHHQSSLWSDRVTMPHLYHRRPALAP